MIIHLDSTLGAGYVGNVAAAVLFGVTCIQTFIFFNSCKRDSVSLRVLVFTLWFLDALHLCLVSHAIYYYTVSNRNVLALLVPTWSILGQIFVTCASDLIVRYMFGRRLWRLSRNNLFLALTIASLSLFVFGAGTAFGCQALQMKAFAKVVKISWLFYSSLGAAVVADCVIAISLCFLFYKGRTGHGRTDSLLNVLMLYSINTGLITSLAAIICFITYAVLPNQYYYMAVFFVLTGLNVNCLLASLNARSPLREHISLNTSEKHSLTNSQTSSFNGGTESFYNASICIKVETTTAITSLEPYNNKATSPV